MVLTRPGAVVLTRPALVLAWTGSPTLMLIARKAGNDKNPATDGRWTGS
jgi:hypothetical protein